jgi:hypothetical protein
MDEPPLSRSIEMRFVEFLSHPWWMNSKLRFFFHSLLLGIFFRFNFPSAFTSLFLFFSCWTRIRKLYFFFILAQVLVFKPNWVCGYRPTQTIYIARLFLLPLYGLLARPTKWSKYFSVA